MFILIVAILLLLFGSEASSLPPSNCSRNFAMEVMLVLDTNGVMMGELPKSLWKSEIIEIWRLLSAKSQLGLKMGFALTGSLGSPGSCLRVLSRVTDDFEAFSKSLDGIAILPGQVDFHSRTLEVMGHLAGVHHGFTDPHINTQRTIRIVNTITDQVPTDSSDGTSIDLEDSVDCSNPEIASLNQVASRLNRLGTLPVVLTTQSEIEFVFSEAFELMNFGKHNSRATNNPKLLSNFGLSVATEILDFSCSFEMVEWPDLPPTTTTTTTTTPTATTEPETELTTNPDFEKESEGKSRNVSTIPIAIGATLGGAALVGGITYWGFSRREVPISARGYEAEAYISSYADRQETIVSDDRIS